MTNYTVRYRFYGEETYNYAYTMSMINAIRLGRALCDAETVAECIWYNSAEQ